MIFDINMVEEGKLGFITGRDGYFFSGLLSGIGKDGYLICSFRKIIRFFQ
jgi:hypothetical protein